MNNFNEVCKSGNTVAEIREEVVDCDICLGSGEVNKKQLVDAYREYGLDFCDSMEAMRKIQVNRHIDCPICEGRGYMRYEY